MLYSEVKLNPSFNIFYYQEFDHSLFLHKSITPKFNNKCTSRGEKPPRRPSALLPWGPTTPLLAGVHYEDPSTGSRLGERGIGLTDLPETASPSPLSPEIP